MHWRALLDAPRVSLGKRKGWPLGLGLGLAVLLAGSMGFSRPLALSDLVIQADDYFLGRQNPENISKGLELLRADVGRNSADYEAWWRISKFLNYQADHADESDKLKLLDAATAAAKQAIALEPNRVEGHYWLAVSYDLTSEARGYWRGLLFLDYIREEMETANGLDPGYERNGAMVMIARLDYLAPFFKGGDKRLSIQLLKDSLKRYPDNPLAMLYLSDSYFAMGHRKDSRDTLEAILKLCPDPELGPEMTEIQNEARARLAKYFGSGN